MDNLSYKQEEFTEFLKDIVEKALAMMPPEEAKKISFVSHDVREKDVCYGVFDKYEKARAAKKSLTQEEKDAFAYVWEGE